MLLALQDVNALAFVQKFLDARVLLFLPDEGVAVSIVLCIFCASVCYKDVSTGRSEGTGKS